MQEDESKIKWSQFLAGDNDAYCWLYKVYIQMLFRYGHRFTSDTELIKDCIQDVFTGLYKNRKRLSTPDNIKVYLFVATKENQRDTFHTNSPSKRDHILSVHSRNEHGRDLYTNGYKLSVGTKSNTTIVEKNQTKLLFYRIIPFATLPFSNGSLQIYIVFNIFIRPSKPISTKLLHGIL